jgi:two-component system sensor histidine kinase AtoS
MFQPFYSTKPQGTGLGLPLAQQVATEHGGSIQCESRVGDGTIFRIILPVAR